MDGDRKQPPTMEEIHEFMINHFLTKIESSTRDLARRFLEARQWHIDAAVSDFNSAFASAVESSTAATRRNVPDPRDRDPRPLAMAARTLSSILHPRVDDTPAVSSPLPIRLRSPRSPPSRARNPFSREPSQRADNESDEQDQHDAAKESDDDVEGADLPSSSSSLPRRLKFRSISEILSVTPQLVPTTVTVWRNGFTLDDNPLNTLDDPANASFLQVIESLESPRTLDSQDGKQRFLIKLIRRQQEDCYPHEESPKPFQGVGRTIAEPDSVSTEPPPASSDTPTTEPTPSVDMEIDPTAPTTLIPVILSDGTRIISRFNTNHTIRDVRDFIDASTPDASSRRDYQLLIMGLPPRALTDLDLTIEQAGISNSVLTQKF